MLTNVCMILVTGVMLIHLTVAGEAVAHAVTTTTSSCTAAGSRQYCTLSENCTFCSGPAICESLDATCPSTCAKIQSPSQCANSGQCRFCPALQYCTNTDAKCFSSCAKLVNGSFCDSAARCQFCHVLGYCTLKQPSSKCAANCSEVSNHEDCDGASFCQWCPDQERCVSVLGSGCGLLVDVTETRSFLASCASASSCQTCGGLQYSLSIGETCQELCSELGPVDCGRAAQCRLCVSPIQYCTSIQDPGPCSDCPDLSSDASRCLAASACKYCPADQRCVTSSSTCSSTSVPSCQALPPRDCSTSTACAYCSTVQACLDGPRACPESCSDLSYQINACNAAASCTYCGLTGYCVQRGLPCATSCEELTSPQLCMLSGQCHWCRDSAVCAGSASCAAYSCSGLDGLTCIASSSCRYCARVGVCLEWGSTGQCADFCESLSATQCISASKCEYCATLGYCTALLPSHSRACASSCQELESEPPSLCRAASACMSCGLTRCIPASFSCAATLQCAGLTPSSCAMSWWCRFNALTGQCLDIAIISSPIASSAQLDCCSSLKEATCSLASECSFCARLGFCGPKGAVDTYCRGESTCAALSFSLCGGDSTSCRWCYDTMDCRNVSTPCSANCETLSVVECARSATSCQYCAATGGCVSATDACTDDCTRLLQWECSQSAMCHFCSELRYCTSSAASCIASCELLHSHACISASHTCVYCSDVGICQDASTPGGCLSSAAGGGCSGLLSGQCARSEVCQYCGITGSCMPIQTTCSASCSSLFAESDCKSAARCFWCDEGVSHLLGRGFCVVAGLEKCPSTCAEISSSLCDAFPSVCVLDEFSECVNASSSLALPCSRFNASTCTSDPLSNCSYCPGLDVCLPLQEQCPDLCSGLQDGADCSASPNCTYCTQLGYCKNATDGEPCASSCSLLSFNQPDECNAAASCALCLDDDVCAASVGACEPASCLSLSAASCGASASCQFCPRVQQCLDLLHPCPEHCEELASAACAASPLCYFCPEVELCTLAASSGKCAVSCSDLSSSSLCDRSSACMSCGDGKCVSNAATCQPFRAACSTLTIAQCVDSLSCTYCPHVGMCLDVSSHPTCPINCIELSAERNICDASANCIYCPTLGYCSFNSQLLEQPSCASSCEGLSSMPQACQASPSCNYCADEEKCVPVSSSCITRCTYMSESSCILSSFCTYCPRLRICVDAAVTCPTACYMLDDGYDGGCAAAANCQGCSDETCTFIEDTCETCTGRAEAQCKASPGRCVFCAAQQLCIPTPSNSTSTGCLALDCSSLTSMAACVASDVCRYCSPTASCVSLSDASCPMQCEALTPHPFTCNTSACRFCTELSYCTGASRFCQASCAALSSTECLAAFNHCSLVKGMCVGQGPLYPFDNCGALAPMMCAQAPGCVYCPSSGLCAEGINCQATTRCEEIRNPSLCSTAAGDVCHYCTELGYCTSRVATCRTACEDLSGGVFRAACAASTWCRSCSNGQCRTANTSSCVDPWCDQLKPSECFASLTCQWSSTVSACIDMSIFSLADADHLKTKNASHNSQVIDTELRCSELSKWPDMCSSSGACSYCQNLGYCAERRAGCYDTCADLSSDKPSCSAASHRCTYCDDYQRCSPILEPCLAGFPSCSALTRSQCAQSKEGCQFCGELQYCAQAYNTTCATDCTLLIEAECSVSPACHYCADLGYCAGNPVCKTICEAMTTSECAVSSECMLCEHVGYCIARSSSCPVNCFQVNGTTASAMAACAAASACSYCTELKYCGNRSLSCETRCSAFVEQTTCAAAESCHYCGELQYCSNTTTPCLHDCLNVTLPEVCLDAMTCHWCSALGLCNPLSLNCSGECVDYSQDAFSCNKLQNCSYCGSLQYCSNKTAPCGHSCQLDLSADLRSCASSQLCQVCPGPPSYCSDRPSGGDLNISTCSSGCGWFGSSESCKAVPGCSYCSNLSYCTEQRGNGTSCAVRCTNLTDPTGCALSPDCHYCPFLGYCDARDNPCGSNCGDLGESECLASNCSFCGELGYCAASLAGCKSTCYQLIDAQSPASACINAVKCSFCSELGYCQPSPGPGSCDSTCSQITDTSVCEHTLRGCHFVGSFCSEGSCFAFVAQGYNAQPYLLFMLGIFKDLAVLVFVGFVGDWLKFKAKKVFLRCSQGIQTFEMLYTDDVSMEQPSSSSRGGQVASLDKAQSLRPAELSGDRQQRPSFGEYSLSVSVLCFPSADDIMRCRERRKGDETIPVIPRQQISMHHATMHQLIEEGVFYQDSLHVPEESESFFMVDFSSSGSDDDVAHDERSPASEQLCVDDGKESEGKARVKAKRNRSRRVSHLRADHKNGSTCPFWGTKKRLVNDEEDESHLMERRPGDPPHENDTLGNIFRYVQHVISRQETQCYYSISSEPMKRISRSLSLYPGVVALVYYVASALVLLVATTIDVLGIADATPAERFQLIGFRIMNSGVNGTIALLFVKYLRHLLCSTISLEDHEVRNRRVLSGLQFHKPRSGGTDDETSRGGRAFNIQGSYDAHLSSYHSHSSASSASGYLPAASYYRYDPLGAIPQDLEQATLYGHLGGGGAGYHNQHLPHHPNRWSNRKSEFKMMARGIFRLLSRGLLMNSDVDTESPMLVSDYFRFKTSTTLHAASWIYFLILIPFVGFSLIGFALYFYIFVLMAGVTGLLRSVLMFVRAQLSHRRFISVLLDFFINESIPTVFLALLLQTSFNYSLLFVNRELYQLDYSSVVQMEYNARTFGCLTSNLQQQLSNDHDDFSHTLQLLSTMLPFF